MITKEQLKIYLPLACIGIGAGLATYTLYTRLANRENTQLADKPKKAKKTRHANIKEWETSSAEESKIRELTEKADNSSNIYDRRDLINEFFNFVRDGYVLSITKIDKNDPILVNLHTQKETRNHASIDKDSTKAVFHLRRLLKSANRTQKDAPIDTKTVSQLRFLGFDIYHYDDNALGVIKILVGRRTNDKKQEVYCITAEKK